MEYTFELVGVSPILSFFNHQQEIGRHIPRRGAEYLGAYRCTLDAFLDLVKAVPPERQWNLDAVVDSIISFWLNNAEQVRHWNQRLRDAGSENVLVARVGDFRALQDEFEFLLGRGL